MTKQDFLKAYQDPEIKLYIDTCSFRTLNLMNHWDIVEYLYRLGIFDSLDHQSKASMAEILLKEAPFEATSLITDVSPLLPFIPKKSWLKLHPFHLNNFDWEKDYYIEHYPQMKRIEMGDNVASSSSPFIDNVEVEEIVVKGSRPFNVLYTGLFPGDAPNLKKIYIPKDRSRYAEKLQKRLGVEVKVV